MSDPDVVIVGGGLAGLTAAATVALAGRSVVVHEKLGVPGGDARSTEKDGFTLNQGPHALYRGGPADNILRELGVKIDGGRPPIKGRIVFDGQTHVAPAGPSSLLQTRALGGRAKIEIARNLARLPKLKAWEYADLTVSDWVADSVTDERAATMIMALVRLTTYSSHPDQMSADVAVSQMQRALGQGVIYLHRGWQTLIDQLAAMAGVQVRAGTPVAALPDARAVVIAAGGPRTAEALLGRRFDVGPPAQASCLDLGLRRRPGHDFVLGGDVPFYFSNHSAAAELAPPDRHHGAVLQYLGEGDEPDTGALAAFARHAGVGDDDVIMSRSLHRMTPVSAQPTAAGGGMAGRPLVTDSGHDNVFLAGDWVGPIGHLADAAVASASMAAQAALAHLAGRVGV